MLTLVHLPSAVQLLDVPWDPKNVVLEAVGCTSKLKAMTNIMMSFLNFYMINNHNR
jgi:hypothetical protein